MTNRNLADKHFLKQQSYGWLFVLFAVGTVAGSKVLLPMRIECDNDLSVKCTRRKTTKIYHLGTKRIGAGGDHRMLFLHFAFS